jgi:hypothetical protein
MNFNFIHDMGNISIVFLIMLFMINLELIFIKVNFNLMVLRLLKVLLIIGLFLLRLM